jgi:hypothetical protein
MRWFIRATALFVVASLALPLLAQDAKKPDEKKNVFDEKKDDKKPDEKKPDEKKPDEKKDDKEKLLPAGVVMGKITNLNEEKKTLKVEITHRYQKLNEGEAKAYLDAQAAYQRALLNRQATPQQRAQDAAKAAQDMQTHLAKLYSIEKKTQEVELQLTDDAKIRVPNPPIAFDDDGKAKKYTKAELDKLKGDPKLPGFPAEFGALATGEVIQLTLVKKKEAKPMNPGGVPGVPKPKDLVGDDVLADHFPLASMVVVLGIEEKK